MHIEGLLVWSIGCLRDVLREALNGKGITIVHPVHEQTKLHGR